MNVDDILNESDESSTPEEDEDSQKSNEPVDSKGKNCNFELID